jgi:hypothetical protein
VLFFLPSPPIVPTAFQAIADFSLFLKLLMA